jgi:hypothetical protein
MSDHRGGGKFGHVWNSWPFVTLTISAEGIVLRTLLQEVRLKREAIQGIVLQRNVVNYRFVFHHEDPTVKNEIEFWTFSPEPVAQALRDHGYSVSDAR